jgi:hypothetical protein
MCSCTLHFSNDGGGREKHSFLKFWQGMKRVARKRVKALWKLWTSCSLYVLNHADPPRSSVSATYYVTYVIMCDLPFVENQHSCCSMVSCFRTMQCLITILMFRICCRTGTGSSFHILHMFQTLHLAISFCFLRIRSDWGDTDLNMQTSSTLLSLFLYVIWEGIITGLLLITCHIDWEKCKELRGYYGEYS